MAEKEPNDDYKRIRQIDWTFYRFLRQDIDQALSLIREGKDLAHKLDDSYYKLYFAHWELQALLHFKRDIKQALGLAVQATVEARKPAYANYQERICIHEDLINAYIGTDPQGYADMIAKAIDYMGQEIGPGMQCRFCLQGIQFEFAWEMGQVAQAEEAALELLATCDWGHHRASAYTDLCQVAFSRQDWQQLMDYAQTGEETARKADREGVLATVLAWQAFCLRQRGEEEEARKRYRTAVYQGQQLTYPPGRGYYNALTAFHELGQEWTQALAVRTEQLGHIAGKGSPVHEVRIQLDRCRFLANLGQSTEETAAAIHQVAQQLRHPSPHLTKLEHILAGGNKADD